ncbi:MAG TPA: GNAT family N-acetyltransferase [Acidimicrobiales bacterium]|nr:GNAT family N-acetyltransferase [Acidimicrobiales bacterium]
MTIRGSAPPVAAPLGPVKTTRLDLRAFMPSDLDELAEVFSHPEVWQFPYGRAFTRQETQAFLDRQLEEWSECGFGCWVARALADGRIIGYVGLSVPTFLPEILPAVEVGWRFAPTSWGHGYATEGATAALDEGFTTLGLERVCSVPQSDNPPSARVAERLGMKLMREVVIPANERRSELHGLLYEIDRRDWLYRTRS